MKKRGVVLFALLFSQLIYAQWIDLGQNLSKFGDGGASAMDAIDSLTAVISFYGDANGIAITEDGGKTWTKINDPIWVKTKSYTDIELVNPTKIITCERGKIFRTENAGMDWFKAFDDTTLTTFINYIEMFDEINGVAMGDALNSTSKALFLKTENGGYTWTPITNELTGMLSGATWKRLDFVNPATGFFIRSISGYYPALLKTSDSGTIWMDTEFPELRPDVVKFANEYKGIVYSGNSVSRTSDGGETWETIQFSNDTYGADIEFFPSNENSVFLACYDALYFSIDGGLNWEEITDFSSDLKNVDIKITSDNCVWVFGNDRFLYKNNRDYKYTSVTKSETIPAHYNLDQNFPNPFNPSTIIKFSMPERSFVKLSIIDILGREIKTLVEESRPAGNYTINFNAQNLSSGIYFYKLETSSYVDIKKMVLIK